MVELILPAAVLPTPATLEAVAAMAARIRGWSLGTLYLLGGAEGLDPLVVAHALACEEGMPPLGLCVHGRDKNGNALASDYRTAAALKLCHLFLKEPDYRRGRAVNFQTSLTIIEQVRACHGEHFSILVENAFLHPSDEALLAAQLEAGADRVASRFVPGYLDRLAAKYEDITIPFFEIPSEEGRSSPGRPEGIADLSSLAGEVVFERGDRIFR